MKLQHKLLVSFLFVGLIPLLAIGVYVNFPLKNQKFRTISDSILAQLTQIDNTLSAFLQEVGYDVETLASAPLVSDREDEDFTSFLQADEQTFTYIIGAREQQIIDIFANYRTHHAYVNSVYMGRENGAFVRSHRRARPTQYDPRERPWYQLAVSQPARVMRTAPYKSVTTDDVNIGIVKAMVDHDNKVYGVVGMDITLCDLTRIMTRIHTSEEGYLFLLDEQGIILSHPLQERRFLHYEEADLDVLHELMTRQQGYLRIVDQGQAYYIFFYTSPFLGWKICAAIPVRDIEREITQFLTTIMLVLVLTFVLGGGQAYYLAQRITVPIRDLIRHITTLVSALREKKSFAPIRITTHDEIATLADAFNTMGREVFKAQRELDAYSHNLEHLVADRTRELSQSNAQLTQEIAERKRVEEALRQAKDAAEAANEAKSLFLANMSHELRTPLNGILGYAQILKMKKNLTEFQYKGLNVIEQSGKHLLNLINDILDLSRIEAQKLDLKPSAFAFLAFLHDIVEIIRVQTEKKGLTFQFECNSDVPEAVYADEKRLSQILLNLLGNAVKFTESGSITFRVKKIENYQLKSENRTIFTLQFEVEDTGIGIADDQLDEIFSAFKQVGKHVRTVEGTGLGLTISRQLVQLMGGTLEVSSAEGQGTRFWFDLCFPEVTEWVVPQITSEQHITGFKYAGETVPKILVVDDKMSNRALLVNLLESLGFDVQEAVDGRDALQRSLAFHPDLILMDLIMPVMDGFEAIRQIRSVPGRLSQTKIIAVSASTLISPERIRSEFGCDDYLPKPLQIQDALEKLALHLHLEWTYKEQEDAHKEESHNSPETQENEAMMTIPPESELITFYTLTQDGNFSALRAHLDQFEQTHPQYTNFVQRIRQFARTLADEAICEFLDGYIGNSGDTDMDENH